MTPPLSAKEAAGKEWAGMLASGRGDGRGRGGPQQSAVWCDTGIKSIRRMRGMVGCET